MKSKIIKSVKVNGEKKRRAVYYVRREILFDDRGRVCQTPLELGRSLTVHLERRDAEAVAGIVWSALNFVHNGKVPRNWLGVWKKYPPVPLAV